MMKKLWNDSLDSCRWEGIFMISLIKRNLKAKGWKTNEYGGIWKEVDGEIYAINYHDSLNGRYIVQVGLRPEKQMRKKVAGRINKRYKPMLKTLASLSQEVDKALEKSQPAEDLVKEYKLFKRLEKKYGGW